MENKKLYKIIISIGLLSFLFISSAVLYNYYKGRTGYGGKFFNKFGIYHSWISRWNDEVHGEYPTQVVYYDNLFRTNKKEKLLKLIQN